MHSKSNPSDYMRSVLAVRAARITNIVCCAVFIALTLAGAALAYGTTYRYTALCLALALAVLLGALIFKNAKELRAVARIAGTGVYAARLSREQQRDVRRALVREGRAFSFTAFLILTTLEAVVLVIMYIVLKSEVFLLFLAGFSLASFGIAVLSPLYLSARLSKKNAFCTVSENGALLAGEVIPFSTRRGDPLELLCFDDYYLLRLRRDAVFGITYRTKLLLPANGALKHGIDKPIPAALAETLGLGAARELGAPYYESRDYTDGAGKTVFKPADTVGA